MFRRKSRENKNWLWGPVKRDGTRIDESALVLNLFPRNEIEDAKKVMVDVGAHFGSSLREFARRGWKVIAFEPDTDNRERLETVLEDEWEVVIDSRAVSDHSESGLPFYRSEVSTGISGLSAFHESHRFSQPVDVVALQEALEEYGVAHVDFLKIDTEGHDLKVLQGYPWQTDLPTVIVSEFEDNKLEPGSATNQAEFLHRLGYCLFISEWHPIIRYGISHDFRGIWKFELGDEVSTENWGNIIAVQPNMVKDIEKATLPAIINIS